MNGTTFATVEATTDPVAVVVRFNKTVKVERPNLRMGHPEDEEDPELAKMKRTIETQVLKELNDSYFSEPTMVVCRTNQEIVNALEDARAAYELARALTKAGKYVTPRLSLPSPPGF
jgi:hypothetical protein